MKNTYLAYASFADSVKEVGCRILEIIADNEAAVVNYHEKAADAAKVGSDGSYFIEYADRLEAQNKLWSELEANLRMKYIEGEGW